MKVLVVCLLVSATLLDAAPSEVSPGDAAALPPDALTSLEKTSANSGVTPNAGTSSSSSPVSNPLEKTSADSDAAALPAQKVVPAADVTFAVTPIDVDKVKAERQDKGSAPVDPVVEAAAPEPSMFSGLDVPVFAPAKKVPVFGKWCLQLF